MYFFCMAVSSIPKERHLKLGFLGVTNTHGMSPFEFTFGKLFETGLKEIRSSLYYV